MCSCLLTSIHSYRADVSLWNNLFRLDFSPPPGEKFGFCECPSSYLFNGLEVGIPATIFAVLAGLLFFKFRKPAIWILAITVFSTFSYFARYTYLVYQNYYTANSIPAPEIWHYFLHLLPQALFNLTFFVVLPLAIAWLAAWLVRLTLRNFRQLEIKNAEN